MRRARRKRVGFRQAGADRDIGDVVGAQDPTRDVRIGEEGIERGAIAVVVAVIRRSEHAMRRQGEQMRTGIDRREHDPGGQVGDRREGGRGKTSGAILALCRLGVSA